MGDAGKTRPSTSNAVWGRRLCKSYGKGKALANVLNGLNINVPYGAIYGLLGPSGCGKTTLLRCIVGLLEVDSGALLAMGDKPGSRDHSVPGPMVGYMPQEISLYNELRIEELLLYFGRVHGMTRDDVTYRTNFLLDFLKLPARSERIGFLSGGQKRRASLAAALLHKPGLLILDEPTVGVDPVLREKIWEHLLEIAQSTQQTTIIITTHYIEEARQADRVGLMRAGRMLDEDKPSALMDRYNMVSLEAIFLHLCHHDLMGNAEDEELMSGNYGYESDECTVSYEDKKPLLSSESGNSATSVTSPSYYGTVTMDKLPRGRPAKEPCCVLPALPSFRVMLALVIKNLTVMQRSIGLLFFEFIIPSIQIVLFCLCIGRAPHNLTIGVVNKDNGNMGSLYLNHLDNATFIQVLYDDVTIARNSVKEGTAWGVVEIGPDFSMDLMLRFQMGDEVTTEVVEGSTIILHLDFTSQQISAVIHTKTLQAFQQFSTQTLAASNHNVHYSDPPIMMGDPVYGKLDSVFTEFMTPGICNSITFFMATGLTTLALVLEKKEGTYERNLVNGVTPAEIMLSHVFTQFLVLVVQVSLLMLCTFSIFRTGGSWMNVMALILMQGLCGMCLGIMISCCCEKETSAMQLSLGLVYPLLLTSGIIWPIQAVPEWLMYVSEALPLTIATDALRSVMGRGWGISRMGVWLGYLITMGWCLVFLGCTALIGRIRR